MVLFSAHQAVQACAGVEVDDAPVIADVEDVLQTKCTAGVKVLHSGVLKWGEGGGEGFYWLCSIIPNALPGLKYSTAVS